MHTTSRGKRLAAFSLTALATAIAVGCATGVSTDEDATLVDPNADPAIDSGRRTDARSDSASYPGVDANEAVQDAGATTVHDAGAHDAAINDAGAHDASDAATHDAATNDASPGDDDAGGGATKPTQGEVVISEVLFDSSGTEPDTEWIEIYNAASGPRLLSGLVLKDGSNRTHTIRAGVVVAPGSYVVLASMKPAVVATGIDEAVVVYDYNTGESTQIQLANGSSGGVVLLNGATEVARADYGTLGLSGAGNGVSIQLKTLDYASAGVKTNWCKSANAWATGSDKGTPGAPNDCP